MTISLRVVVPPHPLISHWLTMLRNISTPSPLYATGLEELGHWLSYEAIRDWLRNRKEQVETHNSTTEGQIIESNIPLIAITIGAGGMELWQGARKVLPNPHNCHGGVPSDIQTNAGVILFIEQIATGETLLNVLSQLKDQNVQSKRIRVITALASNPGLQKTASEWKELNIYCACIDPEVSDNGDIVPGIGNPTSRLNTRFPASN